MNVKWLVDPEVFEADAAPLLESLRGLGVEHTVCAFGTQYESYINKFVNEESPVIFYGCLQFAKQIKSITDKITVFCNLPKMECVFYYPRFGEYLLNTSYIMLPFGELLRKQKWIFDHFDLGNGVFIRPSSGYKTFPGMVVNRDAIEKQLRSYSRIVDLHELTVIAPAQYVKNEWRLVVVNGKVVTGGQYKKDGAIVRIKEVPDSVIDYASDVLGNVQYRPDPAWTLDICDTDSQLKVLEVGSFSCAGLYACDTDAIVQAINKLVSCTK